MPTERPDNLDLRRRRKNLRLSLDDIALALGFEPDAARAAISRFERGIGRLPYEKGREDYERVLGEREAAVA